MDSLSLRDIKYDIENTDISSDSDDLTLVSGKDNLAQAVALRLLTPVGTLPFHPEYGSRLHQMIGKGQSEVNEQVAKMLVGEALMKEKRIAAVDSIDVTYSGTSLIINIDIISTEDQSFNVSIEQAV